MRAIIEGFTVVVALLVISAGYVSLASHQTAAAAPLAKPVLEKPVLENAPAPDTSWADPAIRVSLELRQTGDTELKVTGAEIRQEVIHALPKGRNVKETVAILRDLKERWPKLDKVTLLVERNVLYSDVVRTLEAGKAVVPTIQLGGL